MLIPKSYLTTPLPKTHPNGTQMTDSNDALRNTLFSKPERDLIEASKKQLTEAVDPWLLNHTGIVIAGGCWASAIQGETIKDIDIFVLDRDEYGQNISDIRNQMFILFPTLKHRDEKLYRIVNPNIIDVWTTADKKVQVIYTKHKTRKDLIEDFDYLHCRASYWGGKFYITREIFDAIIKKKLILKNEKNFQEWRRDKFLNRGYTIGIHEIERFPAFSGPIKMYDQIGDFVSGPEVGPSSAWGSYLTNIAKNV